MAYLDPKGKGDETVPENRRSCPGVWGRCCGESVIWRKLDCLKPNLQKMEVHIRRKDAWNRRRLCNV